MRPPRPTLVASLALEHGATENEAIAAVLHDAVEDHGGAATAARIRELGAAGADIVVACSDTDVLPKPPWCARKETAPHRHYQRIIGA